jgi:Ca2+/Na+ antiporter
VKFFLTISITLKKPNNSYISIMSKLLIIFCAFVIISCKSNKSISDNASNYKVIKIDSLENVYIISAELYGANNEIDKFKIVSSRNNKSCKSNNIIKENNSYKLLLKSLRPEEFQFLTNLVGIEFDGTIIPFEKTNNSKKTLFITNNLDGLCYRN